MARKSKSNRQHRYDNNEPLRVCWQVETWGGTLLSSVVRHERFYAFLASEARRATAECELGTIVVGPEASIDALLAAAPPGTRLQQTFA